ncbi:VOC family protein [Parafrankia sp. EAN1pec]|uniref:VOC family protein n=1 Tax=Parafrankia sp. (strain EAN1pec) TaxID=298653 RepID=UPI00321A0E08
MRPSLPIAAGGLGSGHPGRAKSPVVKVVDLAFLEFERPDLDRSEAFARDFGFAVAQRTPDTLMLRGILSGGPCMMIRRSTAARFVGPAFAAADATDLNRLAQATDATVRDLATAVPAFGGGILDGATAVELRDPTGLPVRVVHGIPELPALDEQHPLVLNVGSQTPRVNLTQRPPREPARVQRLGHLVLESPVFGRALDWYLQTLGLIVSDFLFLDGQRDRGPTMAFIRCDQGRRPVDHHTLAMLLGPSGGYVHSAYQVSDLDALAAGGEYLRERGWRRSWGIGRHIQGSQIFDYWRDPDGFLVEHFTDGDLFDASTEPTWTPMSASGLAQWGPRATTDFLGTRPSPRLLHTIFTALRGDNEIDLARIKGLKKAMSR